MASSILQSWTWGALPTQDTDTWWHPNHASPTGPNTASHLKRPHCGFAVLQTVYPIWMDTNLTCILNLLGKHKWYQGSFSCRMPKPVLTRDV